MFLGAGLPDDQEEILELLRESANQPMHKDGFESPKDCMQECLDYNTESACVTICYEDPDDYYDQKLIFYRISSIFGGN
jgi:hypothetical protein